MAIAIKGSEIQRISMRPYRHNNPTPQMATGAHMQAAVAAHEIICDKHNPLSTTAPAGKQEA